MPKAKISVSMEVELIRWIDEQVGNGVFRSRSEGIERCTEQIMRKWRCEG